LIEAEALREPSAPPPLLQAEDARIAVDDVIVVDRLTLTTRGARVLVVGDGAPLAAAIMGTSLAARGAGLTRRGPGETQGALEGECRVVAGALRVAGLDVAKDEHVGAVGSAPLDPPLPGELTALEYVAWSGRLAGMGKGAARSLAQASLAKVGLEASRETRIQRLAAPARRALLLAQAMVASPRVLVADAPFEGLEAEGAAYVVRALAAATEGRGAIVALPRLDPATPSGALAAQATDVVVLAGGQLVLHASGAELGPIAGLYALTVRTNAEALKAELSARGIELRGGPERFSAQVPPGAGPSDLLAAAAKARAAVVEIRPLL
jgi:ABC-2 type transport system ATP-binding protein